MTLCKHTRMFANKLSLPSDTLNAPKLEISSEPILAYVLIYKGELRRTRGLLRSSINVHLPNPMDKTKTYYAGRCS